MALKVPNPLDPNATEKVNVTGTSPSEAKMQISDVSKIQTAAPVKTGFETKSATGIPTSVNGKPTAYTGVTTPEGVTNPYTGGTETASPKGTLYGVNQGVYSPENKQKAWTSAGGTGNYNPDAFYRGSNSEMLIKEGAIPKAPVSETPVLTMPLPASAFGSQPKMPEGTTSATSGITGIAPVDTELEKLRKEKQKSIDDAYRSYELAKGNLEQNKAYYTNFDDVNARFTNVTNDVKNAMQAKGETFLTDEEYKKIADKYGIGLSEVKNPVSVFNALNLSDEGKTKFGVTKYDQGLADLKTSYERQKADIATSLANTEKNMNAQIDDAANTINRNINVMSAQGAWSGAQRSTGYSQGLENVRTDGQNVVKRMNDQLANTQTQSHLEIQRLGEDYDKNLSRAKSDLDTQLKNLKFDNGLLLSEASAKYGTGSDELTKALDAIKDEFASKSLDVYNKYLSSVKSTNDLTTQKLEQISKIDDLTQKLSDRRYNEYVANNGALLANTSLTNVHNELNNGTITAKRYEDLRNVMQNSVVNTLGKFGTVSEHDLNSISHMLDTGSTPAQIVAQMRALPQYQKKVVDKVIDLGTKKRVQYADGSFEDIAETKSPIAVGSGSEIFDPNTGTYIPRPSGTVSTYSGELKNLTSERAKDGSGKIAFTGNVGKDLNNPGNLVRGGGADKYAIGYVNVIGKDGVSRDFLVFPSLDAGYKGVESDLNAKISGNSSHITPKDTLSRLLDVWVGGSGASQGYKDTVARVSGYDLNSPIAGMDASKILDGIKSPGAENAAGTGNDYSALAPSVSEGFTDSQKNMMDALLGKKTVTKDDMSRLNKAGVSDTQFYDYKASKSGDTEMTEKTGYTDSELALMSKIDTLTKETKATLADAGLSEKDWAKFQDGQLPPSGSQKKTAVGIVDAINALETHDGLSDAVGFKGLQTGYTVPGSDKADFMAKFNAFRDQLVLPNLGQLKGPMSDKDVQFLRNTATSLSPDMSEAEFKSTLEQLRKKYQEIIDKSSGSAQSQPSGNSFTANNGKTYSFPVK